MVKETNRLILRPFTGADAAGAFAWFGDADVMRFIGGGADRTVDDTANRLSRYITHQERHGFSKWLVQDKESGQAIGDAGLLILDELEPIADLGFRLAKSQWGRGLATEAATAWLHTAFEELQLQQVSAFAHVDNMASLRVLEKIGFRMQKRQVVMGVDSYTFLLLRREYSTRSGTSRSPGGET